MSTALMSSCVLLMAALLAPWFNLRRKLNFYFAVSMAYVAMWLLALHLALCADQGIGWWRVLGLLGAFATGFFLVIFRVIADPLAGWLQWVRYGAAYIVAGLVLAIVALGTDFVQMERSGWVDGGGWFAFYWWVKIGLLLALFGQVIWGLRGVHGVVRLEVQIFLLGGIGAMFLGNLLLAAQLWWGGGEWVAIVPLLMMLLVLITGWTLISHRLMDGRQLVGSALGRMLLLAVVMIVVWATKEMASVVLGESSAFLVAVGVGLWFAAEFWPWLGLWIQQHAYPDKIGRAAQNIAKQELHPEAMEDAYINLLQRWANCPSAVVLMRSHQRLVGAGIDIPVETPEMQLLQKLGWVTPERLERESERPEFPALRKLMHDHNLAVLVSSSPALAMVLGLAVSRSLKPYTFPQIRELRHLAGIMESALSRAHYLMKTQHSDRLATVGLLGASIAHEIRNPLVTIKTFVQLLPKHYHEAVFRDKFFNLIGDEVSRIDRMTEQLLDLAAPRIITPRVIEINLLLSECLALIRAKADDKGVILQTNFTAQPNLILADANAVKQVVLNLGFNAIQAMEQVKSERWLKFTTRNDADMIELTIEDNGPGLAPEVWGRLFQPFHSTKSSGFGLGLAICKDILSGMNATIRADQPKEGCGATFRIQLPCPPPSS